MKVNKVVVAGSPYSSVHQPVHEERKMCALNPEEHGGAQWGNQSQVPFAPWVGSPGDRQADLSW